MRRRWWTLIRPETEWIVEYVLQDDDRLRLAAMVVEAFPEVRRRIIVEFSRTLERELAAALGDGWVVSNLVKEDPFRQYTSLGVARSQWAHPQGEGNLCEIRLETQKKGGRWLIFGVWRDAHRQAPELEGLKERLAESIRRGSRSHWWPYYFYVDEPYMNWDGPEGLLVLRSGAALDYWLSLFRELVEEAAPFIDGAVAAWQPAGEELG